MFHDIINNINDNFTRSILSELVFLTTS